MRVLRTAGLFTFLAVAAQAAVDFASRVEAQVASLSEPFQGTVLISRGDKVLFARGYGLADRSAGVANTAGTRYLIGSITKQFTAVLALHLAQEGLVDLDAPIATYVPEYPESNGSRITLRHLLAHRSGIRHHAQGIPRYFDFVDRIFRTPREYLTLFWERPLAHDPGAGFTYSSPGYTLLGIALENATGKSYAELLAEHVTGPLGLAQTSVNNNLAVHSERAQGYRRGLTGYLRARDEEESTRGAAGVILTTAGDLARFERVFGYEADAVLNAKSKASLLERHSENYAFAGSVYAVPYNGGKDRLTIVSHSGSSYGFMARVDRLIEKGTSILALSNDQDMNLAPLFDRVGNVVLAELCIERDAQPAQHKHQQPAAPAVDAGVDTAEYEGLYYSLELQKTYRVVRRDGRLTALAFLGPADVGLTPERKDVLRSGAGVMRMDRGEDGLLRGFYFSNGRGSSYFLRRDALPRMPSR